MDKPVRRVILRPFITGPRFIVTLWATNRVNQRGGTVMRFRLVRREGRKSEVLFDDVGFCGSPLHADDSDATMLALIGFLCLAPGDTDPEYFAGYSPRQLEWAQSGEAEMLEDEARWRFRVE